MDPRDLDRFVNPDPLAELWHAEWRQVMDREIWFFEVLLSAPFEGEQVVARCDSKEHAKTVHAAMADWCERMNAAADEG